MVYKKIKTKSLLGHNLNHTIQIKSVALLLAFQGWHRRISLQKAVSETRKWMLSVVLGNEIL